MFFQSPGSFRSEPYGTYSREHYYDSYTPRRDTHIPRPHYEPTRPPATLPHYSHKYATNDDTVKPVKPKANEGGAKESDDEHWRHGEIHGVVYQHDLPHHQVDDQQKH